MSRVAAQSMQGPISLEATPAGLQVVTPYDEAFLFAFKATVPYAARQWRKPAWIVDPAYVLPIASLICQFFGVTLTLPDALTRPAAPAQPEIRAIRLDYLGQCKDRGDGTTSAYGYAGGDWSIVAPVAVLQTWFQAAPAVVQPGGAGAPPTLYAVLGIGPQSTADEIKKAHRRMAKQWHPDYCKESDAAAQFQAIQHAYEVLKDDRTRRKYDAGLALEASLAQPKTTTHQRATSQNQYGYRAPLRCGLLLAEGTPRLGRFVLTKIITWDDITDTAGRTLSTSWDSDSQSIVRTWI
jgi:hypothetical protein